jgi:hypothetical protein
MQQLTVTPDSLSNRHPKQGLPATHDETLLRWHSQQPQWNRNADLLDVADDALQNADLSDGPCSLCL